MHHYRMHTMLPVLALLVVTAPPHSAAIRMVCIDISKLIHAYVCTYVCMYVHMCVYLPIFCTDSTRCFGRLMGWTETPPPVACLWAGLTGAQLHCGTQTALFSEGGREGGKVGGSDEVMILFWRRLQSEGATRMSFGREGELLSDKLYQCPSCSFLPEGALTWSFKRPPATLVL